VAERPNQKWIADFTYIWTAEGGHQLLGNMLFNVSDEIIDQLVRLLLADPFLFGVAITGITEISTVEWQVDVFGEAADYGFCIEFWIGPE
jgi:transposase InsO family protein